MRLAVVIPTLDEEDALRANLPAAAAISEQLVVSDGGSSDATVAVARAAGARVVSGPPGRGPQLNRGAAACDAELLLFLHADSRPPPDAAAAIRAAVAAGAEGGGFAVRFIDGGGGVMRLGTRLVNLRTRLTRLPLGDQGQFVTRAVFDELAGFREWPILEDLDFMRRLKRRRRLALLRQQMGTSARRYRRRGIARTVAINWLIWALYLAGVAPERLARLYRQVR